VYLSCWGHLIKKGKGKYNQIIFLYCLALESRFNNLIAGPGENMIYDFYNGESLLFYFMLLM
jgi:hypothetical protein